MFKNINVSRAKEAFVVKYCPKQAEAEGSVQFFELW